MRASIIVHHLDCVEDDGVIIYKAPWSEFGKFHPLHELYSGYPIYAFYISRRTALDEPFRIDNVSIIDAFKLVYTHES